MYLIELMRMRYLKHDLNYEYVLYLLILTVIEVILSFINEAVVNFNVIVVVVVVVVVKSSLVQRRRDLCACFCCPFGISRIKNREFINHHHHHHLRNYFHFLSVNSNLTNFHNISLSLSLTVS